MYMAFHRWVATVHAFFVCLRKGKILLAYVKEEVASDCGGYATVMADSGAFVIRLVAGKMCTIFAILILRGKRGGLALEARSLAGYM
jgi:hypothetical protein